MTIPTTRSGAQGEHHQDGPAGAPGIEVRGVSRRLGRTLALDEVELSFPRDAVSGLLGRNGAGKTTLMSLIAGHDRPDAGEVRVLGHRPFENAAVLPRICLIRDNQRYPDDFRLKHVLRVVPAFHERWDAQLAERIVDALRIPSRTPIAKFSRGQLSSVAILIGLAARAPVTIFDEPYLGLDATARRIFYDLLLADISEHPRTVLVSTHLIDEMEPLLEHVVVLDHGRVLLDTNVEAARGRALTVNGTASAVEDAVRGRRVLRSQSLGGLRSVTVEASADDVALTARRDVEISPVSLQDLVAAYGAAGAEPEPALLEGASR